MTPDPYARFSWQTDLIAKIVQDPELDQLAASIRAKEQNSMLFITIDKSRIDSYSDSPLGGPLVALRIEAAKNNPAVLHAFLTDVIAKRDNIWGRFEYSRTIGDTADYDSIVTLHLGKKEDAYIVNALSTRYTPIEMSSMISSALIAANMNIGELNNCSLYYAQLSSKDTATVKAHYVKNFVQNDTIDIPLMDSWGVSQLESFLDKLNVPSDSPTGAFSQASLTTKTSSRFERIADALLGGYDIDTIVPLLETYQGNRALNGSSSSTDLVSDVRAYLNERTDKTLTTSEVNSDLKFN